MKPLCRPGARTERVRDGVTSVGMPPSSVHFNGSVNLPDAETVMREISSRVPHGVRRMTDGETGDRNSWIRFQIRKFQEMPEFQQVERTDSSVYRGQAASLMPLLRLADGVQADAVRWPDLGYADAYLESFQLFRSLQDAGTIPPDVRFQLQYPTPLAPVAGTFVPADIPAVAVAYGAALFADLDRALATLPHDRCAVQWDVAVEFALLEGTVGPPVPVDRIASGLAQCADHVPADVPVGVHLCYGDAGHQHFKQPESLEMQVRLVNAIAAAAHRPLAWFSFTVPQDRAEEGYFAPLRALETGPETETVLRGRALPPRRAVARHHCRAGAADRRRPGPTRGWQPRVGGLYRVRHGPRGERRRAAAAGPASGDPRRLLPGLTRGGAGTQGR